MKQTEIKATVVKQPPSFTALLYLQRQHTSPSPVYEN